MDRTERGKHSQLIKRLVAVYSRKTNPQPYINNIGRQPEKLKIAKQMLQDEEPMDKIERWTGLSEEEMSATEYQTITATHS